jgi:transcriptional regulator with XRE-family HTH domain
MSLTTFGKAVRSARIQTDSTLKQMAETLNTTPAFLSGIETGRKKIPTQWIAKIDAFFNERGVPIPDLEDLATVSNGQVTFDGGLSPSQHMLLAGFARTTLDPDQLKNFEKLLRDAMKRK